MAGLGTTTMKLTEMRNRWREQLADAVGTSGKTAGSGGPDGSHLREVTGFGSNPGHLRMFTFAPSRLPASPALVLVLHGCTQDAAGYDAGAGWSTLAERHGFALVFAQQTTANNQKACFNWFLPADTARGKGEALSIREMVEHAASEFGVDRDRIFVTGLSAGGAMAAAMLAAYPEVFAGGGIVAGLPYGVATNLQQALGAMFTGGGHSARNLGEHVREASSHTGPWPRVSIWHGTADTVVTPGNGDDLIRQWTGVHGLDASEFQSSEVDGQVREVWRDASGREVVEAFHVAGMGHGTPLQVGAGNDRTCGEAGPFLLDVGISSTHHMAAFWGLTGSVEAHRPAAPARTTEAQAQEPRAPESRVAKPRAKESRAEEVPNARIEILPPERPSGRADPPRPHPSTFMPGGEIGTIINDALRRAGLMKG